MTITTNRFFRGSRSIMAVRHLFAAWPLRMLSLGFASLAGVASCLAGTTSVAVAQTGWPAWDAFVKTQIQADGRVVDHTTSIYQSTSEGQSYALFLALVANDRQTFDTVLKWTADNLCAGKLDAQLPAWQWGRKSDGSYGVIDANSAADADAWIAYTLFEAGRLWQASQYTNTAHAVLAHIRSAETAELPGLGEMLLPGARGFAMGNGAWRLNLSYLPLPLLRRFAGADPGGPWSDMAAGTVRLAAAASPHSFAPDWLAWRASGGAGVDPVKGDVGSYDAIRIYLWAGMTSPRDPLAKPLLAALGGMRRAVDVGGMPPEQVATQTGEIAGVGPVGFSAALIPYLSALGDEAGVTAQARRIAATRADVNKAAQPLAYYDRVLLLFGMGWAEHRYRFDEQGRLMPSWRAG
jgi:endo-1,4-beta-D-glucanase Y